MNLDDLVNAFDAGFQAKLKSEDYPRDAFGTPTLNRAGVRAVAEALRNEMLQIFGLDPFKVDKFWKDAIGSNDGTISEEPDAESKVCNWTDRGHEWVSSCKVSFGAFASTKGRFFCPSCNKPISYGVGRD